MIIWIIWVSLLLLMAPRASDALPIPSLHTGRPSYSRPSQLAFSDLIRSAFGGAEAAEVAAAAAAKIPLEAKLEAIVTGGCPGCNDATRLCDMDGQAYLQFSDNLDEPRLAALYRQLDGYERGCTARTAGAIAEAIREEVHAAATTATDLTGGVREIQALGRVRQFFLDLADDDHGDNETTADQNEGEEEESKQQQNSDAKALEPEQAALYVQQVYDTAWLFVLDASPALWGWGAPPTPSALTVDWLARAAEHDATTVQLAASARSEWFRFASAAGLPSYAVYVAPGVRFGEARNETVTFDGLAAGLRVVLGPHASLRGMSGHDGQREAAAGTSGGDSLVSRFFSLFEKGRKKGDAAVPAEVRAAAKMELVMKADPRVDLAAAFAQVTLGEEQQKKIAASAGGLPGHSTPAGASPSCLTRPLVGVMGFVNEVMGKVLSMWGRPRL